VGVTESRITVLLVDDHEMARRGLAAALCEAPDCEVVGEASTAGEALTEVRRLLPRVVVLDVSLADSKENGVDVARQIRKQIPRTQIVVFTNYAIDAYVRQMLEIGVGGYLLKTAPISAVLNAIRLVATGERVYSPEIIARITDPYLRQLTPASPWLVQTPTAREVEVLQLASEGLSNNEIALRLSISSSSVRMHLANTFEKLGARNRTDAVVKGARVGVIVIG